MKKIREPSNNRVTQKQGLWTVRNRVIAVALALLMVLAVFGTQAQMVEGADEASASSSVEMMEEDEADPDGTVVPADETNQEEDETDPETTAPEETTNEDKEDDKQNEETTETEAEETAEVEITTNALAMKAAKAKAVEPLNIASYLKNEESYLYVKAMDGQMHQLTATEQTGFQVDAQAAVELALRFKDIPGIQEDQQLVYPISDDVLTFGDGAESGSVDNGAEHVGTYEFVHDDEAKVTNVVITIDPDYYAKYQQHDGTMTLQKLYVDFWASLSDDHGEDSKKDNDKTITLSGDGDLTFEVPFAYKNENGRVEVTKSSQYDPATRTIHYTITVSAPASNTLTAQNVKVTDVLDTADTAYIVLDTTTKKAYRNVTYQVGEYDEDKNVWTIGDMAIGTEQTLTYDMVVDDKFFVNTEGNTAIDNTATATFNDTGKVETKNEQPCSGTVLINKNSTSVQSDGADSYVIYTLEVTAYGSTVDNVMVKDAFDFSCANSNEDEKAIQSITEVSKDTGEVTFGKTGLTWKIGTMTVGQTVTMQYKVALNPDAWDKTPFSYNPTRTRVRLHNTAIVGVQNPDNPDELIPYDQDVKTQDIDKTWVSKSSATVDKDNKIYQYTVTVNGAPSHNGIDTIKDALADGAGTYTSDVTLTYYNSSTDTSNPLGTYTIPANGATSFEIDLTNVDGKDISGYYYYKLVYNAHAEAAQTENSVSIGGPGINPYSMSMTVLGSAGFTWGTDFTKDVTGVDYENGDSTWKISVYKNIPAEAMLEDTLGHYAGYSNYGGVYKYGFWWLTQDDLNNIEVKVGGVPLDKSEYTVEKVTGSSNENKSNFESTDDFIAGFKLVFKNGVTNVSKDNPVTIEYHVNIDYSAASQYEGKAADSGEWWHDDVNYDLNDYITQNNANWVRWHLKKATGYDMENSDGEGYQKFTLAKNVPLYKKAGTYDADTGTVTWDIEVNRYSSLNGTATLIDQLPEGFTFVSAAITNDVSDTPSVSNKTLLTNTKPTLGTITTAEVTNSDGKTVTEVTIPIENMSGFTYAGYTNGTNTEVVANEGDKFIFNLAYNKSWMTAGKFTITVTAKVDGKMLNSENDVTFTNNATLKDNPNLPASGVTAAGDVTIPGKKQLTKTMDQYVSGSHVKYTLDVNPDGVDLLSGPDTVTIVDQISSTVGTETGNATLETGKKNYLVVYEVDSDGNKTDITDQCSLDYTAGDGTFKLSVPDDKHLQIEYWIAFSGFVGDAVTLDNTAKFEYSLDDKDTSTPVESKEQLTVRSSRAGGQSTTSFELMKVDDSNNPVPGVGFQLYKVELDSTGAPVIENGTVKLTPVGDVQYTIADDETLEIEGEKIELTPGMIDFEGLNKETIYCYKEVSAPYGYVMDTTLNFVEFQKHEAAYETLSQYGTVHDVVDHDAVLTVVNTFNGTFFDNLQVRKMINGSRTSTAKFDFTFTLKPTGDSQPTVYTDENYKNAMTENGITVTIAGAGRDEFDALYFKEAGTYTFTMTENELTAEATAAKYVKDQSEYLVTIKVGVNTANELEVTSATYQQVKDSTGNAVTDSEEMEYGTNYPTFNNTQALDPGELVLNLKKILKGSRATGVQAGEFTFILSRGEEKVAEATTDADGNVTLTAPLAATDANKTLYFALQEQEGEDQTITYCQDSVIVIVTTAEEKGKVVVTNVKYQTTLNVTDDNVLEVVNTYHIPPPTGIYLNMLPYALMTAFAAGFGVMVLVVRRRKNKN